MWGKLCQGLALFSILRWCEFPAHGDTLLDTDVAFAPIKAGDLDQTGRTRITQKAQPMDRSGARPHNVTVFDLGEKPVRGYPSPPPPPIGEGDEAV